MSKLILISQISKVMAALQRACEDEATMKAAGKSDDWIAGGRDMFRAIDAFMFPIVTHALAEAIGEAKENLKKQAGKQEVEAMEQMEQNINPTDAMDILKKYTKH